MRAARSLSSGGRRLLGDSFRRWMKTDARGQASAAPLKGLSAAATSTPSSGIRAVMDMAWALEAKGVDVIHLEVGPSFSLYIYIFGTDF